MGPVPCRIFGDLWDILEFLNQKHEVPCMALRDLWDRSHVQLPKTYGTGPMYGSQTNMGPVPQVNWNSHYDVYMGVERCHEEAEPDPISSPVSASVLVPCLETSPLQDERENMTVPCMDMDMP